MQSHPLLRLPSNNLSDAEPRSRVSQNFGQQKKSIFKENRIDENGNELEESRNDSLDRDLLQN
jgi:hypothetical protein